MFTKYPRTTYKSLAGLRPRAGLIWYALRCFEASARWEDYAAEINPVDQADRNRITDCVVASQRHYLIGQAAFATGGAL